MMHYCKNAIVDKRGVLFKFFEEPPVLSHKFWIRKLTYMICHAELWPFVLITFGHLLKIHEKHVVADDKIAKVLQGLDLGVEPPQEQKKKLSYFFCIQALELQL